MKQTGLMKHVRAQLARDPTLTTEQLMALIAPLYKGYSMVWLKWSISRGRSIVNRERPDDAALYGKVLRDMDATAVRICIKRVLCLEKGIKGHIVPESVELEIDAVMRKIFEQPRFQPPGQPLSCRPPKGPQSND